ncbi:hypothetical protein N7448_009247 [Penicillium atrosanguineum]|uniref:Uncharacterized protein n=1 Tax=Penicillium atrosanguineum TaxID=1132637 RepID=A0A9W9U7Z1_9EURO|nr:hypothetical protein N7448_009247 [Penicillium atrosanguineum]KAJ5141780.1 hypothetical protein N7526_002775 [Penicillium atrosanguineum]KAJ5321355.1 hypothetical protein N7476_004357 [Penicillium atrosanguineum]
MWQISESADLICDIEYRSLEFFQLHTTQCFGADIGSFLLRAAYHEPIIRTIAVAIGSLHRSFVFEQRGLLTKSEDTHFTLLHYTKAIRQLVAVHPQISPQTNDTFLIACILFFCFECLQGHYRSAFRHATSGLKIISQQRSLPSDTALRMYMPPETITLLFSILENQILEIEGDELLSLEDRPRLLSTFSDPIINLLQPSSTVDDILRSFQILYNRFVRFESVCEMLVEQLENQPFEFLAQVRHIQMEYVRIRNDMQSWMDIFEKWLRESCTIENDARVITMKVWRLVMCLFLDLEWPPSELTWDKYTETFIAINSLVADMLGVPSYSLTSCNSSPGPQTPDGSASAVGGETASFLPLRPKPSKTIAPTFSLSLGVVTPLYLCATRCRDSATRHYAIDLMAYSQRREGLWDAELAGRIAKRIVTIEETGARIAPGTEYGPEEIKLSARVRSLSPSFGEGRVAKIRYNRVSGDTGLVEEVFTW